MTVQKKTIWVKILSPVKIKEYYISILINVLEKGPNIFSYLLKENKMVNTGCVCSILSGKPIKVPEKDKVFAFICFWI